MGIKAFKGYIRVVQALLKAEETDYTLNGVTYPIQFQNQDFKYIDVENPIPIIVSGFGPETQALASKIGDGFITGIPRGGTIPEALENIKKGAKKVNNSLNNFETFALVSI